MKFLAIAIAVCWATMIQAQTFVEVMLKNGGEVKGQLVSLSADGAITVQLDGVQQTLFIDAEEIETYKMTSTFEKPRSRWRTRKWHTMTSASLLSSAYIPGLSLTQTVTRPIHPQVEAGLAASIANYRADEITNVAALAAVSRWYVLDQRTTPYLEGRLGYGWALKDDSLIDAEGGLHYQVDVGYKFERTSVIWHLFVGYHQQSADYTYRNSGETLTEIDITYKRIAVGVGLGF